MAKRRSRSIRTPKRRDQTTPAQREPLPSDGPTPEAIMRRCEELGIKYHVNGGGKVVPHANIKRATDCLGRLITRCEITAVQFQAGFVFGYLHQVVWGKSWPKAADFSEMVHEHLDVDTHIFKPTSGKKDKVPGKMTVDEREEYLRIAQERYKRVDDALRMRTINPGYSRAITRLVCLDGLMPRDAREMTFLHSGLNAIAQEFGMAGFQAGRRKLLASNL